MNRMNFKQIDAIILGVCRRWGMDALRIAVGVVYIWFGALKVCGVSPVVDLINQTYSFMPSWFIVALGVWEAIIGIMLIFRIMPRLAIVFLWMQLGGTFSSVVLKPSLFFAHGNPFLLTTYGEFVTKNIVFLSAGAAIAAREVEA
jgi:putative oxidoreductase